MKLIDGKKYRTRGGEIVGPVELLERSGMFKVPSEQKPHMAGGIYDYYTTGVFYAEAESIHDIVSEYVDAPAEVFVNYYPEEAGEDGSRDGVYAYADQSRARAGARYRAPFVGIRYVRAD